MTNFTAYNVLNMGKLQLIELFRQVQLIERQAYPEFMQGLQEPDLQTWFGRTKAAIKYKVRDIKEALADYCDIDEEDLDNVAVHIFLGNKKNWYLIAIEDEDEVEVADFACLNTVGRDIFTIMPSLLNLWSGKEITMDARESTSYRLLSRVCSRYGYEIIEDEEWCWGDETMHEITLHKMEVV